MMRLPDEVEQQILNASADELMDIPYIKETALQNSGYAYITAKRINHLQVITQKGLRRMSYPYQIRTAALHRQRTEMKASR